MRKNKRWPENCVWPEPVWDGEGVAWEEDYVDPMLLDEDGRELLEIKEYFDTLVEEGRLNEDYSLNEYYEEDDAPGESDDEEEPEEFVPEVGEDYWDDGFNLDAWQDDFSHHVSLLKIEPRGNGNDPVTTVHRVIDYDFVNENLLRQAFTRRAFAVQYGIEGCSEELEFLGDSVLNHIVTREIVGQLMDVHAECTEAPLRAMRRDYDEGVLSRIRSQYVCKEYLAKRAQELGLDQFILYGSGEVPTESSREDMMEALIGAVAVDSSWDTKALERVVDNLLCVQLTYPDRFLKETHYDLLGSWHQKRFGCMPSYEVYDLGKRGFGCTIRFRVPENDKGIQTSQRIDVDAGTRSKAREYASFKAYGFIRNHGLWINLKDAGLVPNLDNSINQLQELYQKKYLDEAPKYEFEQWQDDEWNCDCVCGGVNGYGRGLGKTQAKKRAAYMVLIRLLKSAGICEKSWEEDMWKNTGIF